MTRIYNSLFIKGFTLVELMVTVAVLAIVAMMAAPSFGNMVERRQLDMTTRELALVFGEARGEAIALRKDITIKFECPPSPASCENTSTTYYWVSPREDVVLTSDIIDVIFTATGLAKQRTKMVDNPAYDPLLVTRVMKDGVEVTSITGDTLLFPDEYKEYRDENPSEIPEIVPLEFTLCNADLEESRIIHVSRVGTVDRIEQGECS